MTSSAARSSSRMCSYIVVAVVFSIPPKMKSLTTTCAYLFHGYGTPSSSPKRRIISGVRAKVRLPSASRPLGHEVGDGARPSTVVLDAGELAGDEREEVARVRLVHLPVEDAARSCSRRRARRSRARTSPSGTLHRELGRLLDVRLVVAGEDVARVLVLALRPHLARAVGDVLVRREEVHAAARDGAVRDADRARAALAVRDRDPQRLAVVDVGGAA